MARMLNPMQDDLGTEVGLNGRRQIVLRAIVHNNQLVIAERLREYTLNGAANTCGAIPNRHDDAEQVPNTLLGSRTLRLHIASVMVNQALSDSCSRRHACQVADNNPQRKKGLQNSPISNAPETHAHVLTRRSKRQEPWLTLAREVVRLSWIGSPCLRHRLHEKPRPSGSETVELKTARYHGIRPTDPGGKCGLRNPERGWRIEALISDHSLDAFWLPIAHLQDRRIPGPGEYHWVLDAERFATDGLTILQAYCYLTKYANERIPEGALAHLRTAFATMRKRGLKALLRFAYEKTNKPETGPTLADVLTHIEQLKPIIQENADVIYVMQAGFVGAWGEWHSSAHQIEKDPHALATIMAAILDALPPYLMTQVRVPRYKRRLLGQEVDIDASRIGFHNDGFLAHESDGGTWPEPPHFANPGNPEFDTMTQQSPHLLIDGELFWRDKGTKVDGLLSAIRMRLHHYTTFSLAHSYSEREGKLYSMDDWIATPLSLSQITEARLPISDGYFEDSQGNERDRTPFEYIRDHLGYRLELQECSWPAKMISGDALAIRAKLINRGFSTIHNPRPVIFVLAGVEGVHEFPVVNADPRQWQPFEPEDESYAPLKHELAISAELPGDITPGFYMLGLWLPDNHASLRLDPRYAIRLANRDVTWWTDEDRRYGINVIGVVEIE